MRVSVVIAAYNAAPFLDAAIASALHQSEAPFEVLVVDDGSTDSTPEVARAFADVRYIRQTNRGAAAARNRGVRAARGDYVAVLDADDMWLPNRLQRVGEVLQQHGRPCIVAPDAWVWRSGESAAQACRRGERVFADLCRFNPAGPGREMLFANAPVMHPVFPREALGEAPYDEDLPAYEDTELAWRLVASGLDIVFVSEPLGLYRLTPSSLTRSQSPALAFARRVAMLERALVRCARDHMATRHIRRDLALCRRWVDYIAFTDSLRSRQWTDTCTRFRPWMAVWAARHLAVRVARSQRSLRPVAG